MVYTIPECSAGFQATNILLVIHVYLREIEGWNIHYKIGNILSTLTTAVYGIQYTL